MKTLVADKCKDGWIVKITDTLHLSCKEDVLKVVRENGLKINTWGESEEYIYAD